MKSDLENQCDRAASQDGSSQSDDGEALLSFHVPWLNQAAKVVRPIQQMEIPVWVKSRRWFLLGLATCCTFGGVGVMALVWLATPPPSANCENISLLSPDVERLYCAQQAAKSGDLPQLLAGLQLLEKWPPDHPLYNQAQASIAEWSEGVLRVARQRIEQSDLPGALNLVSQIPKSSPIYQDAQAEVKLWTKQWSKGETIAAKAQAAMKSQKWDESAQYIRDLRDLDHDYWRVQRANTLSRQLAAEERARRLLTQAIQQAQPDQPIQLGAALQQAIAIPTDTYAWTDASKSIQQWSQQLLSHAQKQWSSKNWDGAIATAELLLVHPKIAPMAQDVIWLSQAQKLALASTDSFNPSWGQVGNLTGAITLASLVSPNSQFYRTAQASLQDWRTQLQDVNQLQIGRLLTQLGHPFTYELAVHQAQQINPQHSRRLQAQTLLAQWQKEWQLVQARPILEFATLLADKGTIPYLKAAIEQLQRANLNQTANNQAQSLIAKWSGEIQAIEDRPILDNAWATARRGDLTGAIQIADKIPPGRALYGEAQNTIGAWQAEIYAAQMARIRQHQSEDQKSRGSQSEAPKPTEGAMGWQQDTSPRPWDSAPASEPSPEASEPPPVTKSATEQEPATPVPEKPLSSPTPAAPVPVESFPQPTNLTPAETFPRPSSIPSDSVVIPEPTAPPPPTP